MSQEKVKVIIEVRGGMVQGVYCGDFVEAIVLDHDSYSVSDFCTQPVSDLQPVECISEYDGIDLLEEKP